jgi:hypothetical protein
MKIRMPLAVLGRLLVEVGLFASAGICEAQIYSWNEPSTGQRRLSSIAPPWYDTQKSGGPRTVVTLGPHLLDDTGLPPSERAALQERANAIANRRKALAGEKDASEPSGSRGTTPANPGAAGAGSKSSNSTPTAPSAGSQVEAPPPLSRGGPKPAAR